MGHHLLSISRHPASCSGLVLLLPGRGVGRAAHGHECIPAVSAVNIYVCFSLHMGKQDITETQLQSCLPSQHVLRYKYFYSFSLFLWSSFWVQWEIYSVMFGSSCIFWGWCHETQDAQILPCLNNLSRFYCRAPHHGMQVLPKHSDLQRQGQGRALCFLGMEGRSLLLCTLGRVFPETEGGFVAWVLR